MHSALEKQGKSAQLSAILPQRAFLCCLRPVHDIFRREPMYPSNSKKIRVLTGAIKGYSVLIGAGLASPVNNKQNDEKGGRIWLHLL